MKKNLSLLLAAVLLLSAILACGDSTSSSGGSLLGTWVDNADGTTTVTFTSTTMQMNDNDPAPYTLSNNTISANLSDGSTVTYQAEIDGDTLTLTEDTGNVYTFTRQ